MWQFVIETLEKNERNYSFIVDGITDEDLLSKSIEDLIQKVDKTLDALTPLECDFENPLMSDAKEKQIPHGEGFFRKINVIQLTYQATGNLDMLVYQTSTHGLTNPFSSEKYTFGRNNTIILEIQIDDAERVSELIATEKSTFEKVFSQKAKWINDDLRQYGIQRNSKIRALITNRAGLAKNRKKINENMKGTENT
jgi:hypothetical protein